MISALSVLLGRLYIILFFLSLKNAVTACCTVGEASFNAYITLLPITVSYYLRYANNYSYVNGIIGPYEGLLSVLTADLAIFSFI